MSNPQSPLIVLLGPTASGKTALSLYLAKKYNGFVISADSRQIYQGLDIGTAKITPRQDVWLDVPSGKYAGIKVMATMVDGIYHFLLDIIRLDQEFSLAQYQQEVFRLLRDYHLSEIAGKIPFLVGGTGLYITSVVDNLKIPKVEPHKAMRDSIEKDIAQNGLNFVYQRLLRLDPDAETRVDGQNPRRVIRALEICLSSGKPFTKQQKKGAPLFRSLQLGLKIDQQALYRNIDERLDHMIAEGLEEETKNLLKKFNPRLPAFSGIGYRQLIDLFNGSVSREKAIQNIKRDTKRFVRRQMSWWRRDRRIRWISTEDEAVRLIDQFLRV